MSDTPQTASPARGVSYLYMAAAFVIVVAGMKAAGAILNLLLLAIFLSIISAPAYFSLLRRGVSNWLSLLTVIGVLSVTVFAVVFIVMGSIAGFTANAEHYKDRLDEEQRKIQAAVTRMIPESLMTSDEDSEETAEGEASESGTDASGEADEAGTPSQDEPESSVADTDTEEGAEPDSIVIESDLPDESDLPAGIESPEELAESERSSTASARSDAALGSSLGFPQPTTPVPETEQGYIDLIKEQFSLSTAISLAYNIIGSIGQLLSQAFLILLIVIFILLEAGTFGKKLADAVTRTEETTQRAQQIIGSVHHYIVIKTWVSLATGLLVTFWLWWWGVSHSPLWGLLAFLFNYIPNVGSVLAAVPAVLIAWLEIGALPAVAVAIGFLVINGAIGNFIEPRLMGKSLGLSALVIFFSMLFWGWVLGPVGMLLSVPLTMTARIALDGFDDTRWLATLMGSAE